MPQSQSRGACLVSVFFEKPEQLRKGRGRPWEEGPHPADHVTGMIGCDGVMGKSVAEFLPFGCVDGSLQLLDMVGGHAQHTRSTNKEGEASVQASGQARHGKEPSLLFRQKIQFHTRQAGPPGVVAFCLPGTGESLQAMLSRRGPGSAYPAYPCPRASPKASLQEQEGGKGALQQRQDRKESPTQPMGALRGLLGLEPLWFPLLTPGLPANPVLRSRSLLCCCRAACWRMFSSCFGDALLISCTQFSPISPGLKSNKQDYEVSLERIS